MPLVPTSTIVDTAVSTRTGIGAFNVVHVEHAEAHVAGAEEAGLPVILQISQNAARWHGQLEPIAQAALAVARTADVPVALHLDHATDRDLIEEAADLGFGSIMYDGSELVWEENVRTTKEVVSAMHRRRIWVEAELGEVGGKDGVHAPGVRTDPHEAREFVHTTRVDALAVAIGSSHAMTSRTASLDLPLLSELHRAVPVPLVLHGSSGVPDDDLVRAVQHGMTKINISTHLNVTFTNSVRGSLSARPDLVDTRRYIGPARDAVAQEVARLVGLLDVAGRSARSRDGV